MQNDQQQKVADLSLQAKLPTDFFWGASTAAYQIEGATTEDGRGRSIWDDFAETPGKTHLGETGAIADDHYHRSSEDLGLMQSLGLNAYCFSLSWPRIMPTGSGSINAAGLAFYDRLIDQLLERGITPLVKLYHWDLPAALQAKGGWQNRDTAYIFADYAASITRHFGDRVTRWVTHNEPFCTSYLGHVLGIHAPGLADAQIGINVSHHVLLSHGLALQQIRANTSPTTKVGISLDYYPMYPADDSPATLRATEQADAFRNRWFFDPVFKGAYPDELFACLGVNPPPIQDGDMQLISAPIDFLGLNYYTRQVVRCRDEQIDPVALHPNQTFQYVEPVPGASYTNMNWEVYPQGLLNALERINRDFTPPAIFITESGSAFTDHWDGSAVLHDPERTAYLHDHIQSVARAVSAGIPVQGYFVWSLMDNYEWSEGYSKRFGLIYVDYPTQSRIVKDSGLWYSSFIASQK